MVTGLQLMALSALLDSLQTVHSSGIVLSSMEIGDWRTVFDEDTGKWQLEVASAPVEPEVTGAILGGAEGVQVFTSTPRDANQYAEALKSSTEVRVPITTKLTASGSRIFCLGGRSRRVVAEIRFTRRDYTAPWTLHRYGLGEDGRVGYHTYKDALHDLALGWGLEAGALDELAPEPQGEADGH